MPGMGINVAFTKLVLIALYRTDSSCTKQDPKRKSSKTIVAANTVSKLHTSIDLYVIPRKSN